QTFYAQSRTMANPIRMAAAWLRALRQSVVATATGDITRAPYLAQFVRMGGEIARPLGVDTDEVARAVRQLFQGRARRIVSPRNWFDLLRDVFQIPESATRSAEPELVARELGWNGVDPINDRTALTLLLAAKRVTTDFSSQGEVAKWINTMVPFFTATIGG